MVASSSDSFVYKNKKLISALQKIAVMDVSVLTNTDTVRKTLISENVDQKDIDTVVSIFNNSNINKFLILDKADSIVFNSIVIDIESHCYLSKENAQNFANIILYSFGYGIYLDENNAAILHKKHDRKRAEYYSRYIPCNSFDHDLLTKIGGLINTDNEKGLAAADVSTAFKQLCNAGNAEALYYKGLCYKKGLGTQKDTSKAMKYFELSSEYGNSSAAAELGDTYFDIDMNTVAYEEYTKIGAVSLSKDRRNNVKTLANNKVVVKKSFVFSMILYVISIIYMIFIMGDQLFSTYRGHMAVCVTGLVLCIANAVATCVYYRKKPYDSISHFTIFDCMTVAAVTLYLSLM